MEERRAIREDVRIDLPTQAKWRRILDLVADLLGVPIALIMRAHETDMEVIAQSGALQNAYGEGRRFNLLSGLFCEAIMETSEMLAVTDARQSEKWAESSDAAQGLVACLGFPILWPSGAPFGAICALDNQARVFSGQSQKLLSQFADNMRDDLASLIVQNELQKALVEQILSAQALRESEERFEKSFRSSVTGILITSFQDGIILDANDTYLRLFGYRHDELVGRTAAAVDIYINPEDRNHIIRMLQKGESVRNYEMPLKSKTGEIKYVQGTVERIEISGRDCLITTLFDLTSQKKLERESVLLNERYTLAVRAAQAGIWDWDVVTNTLQWDDQMYRLYDAPKADFAGAYEAWLARLHPEDREISQLETEKALTGEREYDTEFRVVCRDGSVRYIKAYGDVIRDAQGKPLRMVGINLDITEKKQLERDLLRSEALYRDLFDQNSAVRLVIDVETGAIFNANPSACKYYGYPRHALLKKNISDLNRQSADEARHNLDIAYRQKKNYFQGRHTLANGEVRDVEVFNGPLTIQGRKYINCIVHDITQRKYVEEQLMASEARYRNIFYNNYAVQLLIDVENGSIVDANKAACAYYGMTIEEIKAKKLWEFNPTGEAVVREKLRRTFEEGSNHVFTQHLRGDHEVRDVEVFSGRIVIDGRNLAHAIVHDITESKQAMLDLAESERRFRLFVENAPDGIVVQTDSKFAYVNQRAVELFRAASADDLIGKYIPDFVIPEQERLVSERIRELGETQRSIALNEETIVRMDGTQVHVEVSAVPFAYNGKDGALVYLRDITERKEFENAKLEMEMQLRQKQKLESIGTLAGGVAHEINNPINGIINYAELIADGFSTQDQAAEYSRGIIREGRRIAEIVKNLLSFARQEKQSHSPARISDIIEQTLSLMHVMLRRDEIKLELDIPQDLPSIKCRSQQIQQVMMNLISNARDALNAKYRGYNENKIIRIECAVFEQADRRWLKVTVKDNGNGIPADVLERIFDPFFTTKGRGEGTGLGLSISHGIVKEHHGELYFETEQGEYTWANMVLPIDNGWSVD